MARQGTTGISRLWWVPAIASATLAPTVAEVNAGTDLTPFLTRDGFDAPQTSATIDASDASSRVNKTIPGNIEAAKITIKAYRDSVAADDDAWAALPTDAAGFLVERPFGGSAVAVAAAQKVNVWEAVVVSRSPSSWGDEARTFTAECSSEAHAEDLAVLAGT